MSRVKIIKAAGKDWIVGLSWRSFSERPSLRERREDARSLGADWVALRETQDVAQAGFCKAVAGRKLGRVYSLADAVAEEYKQPWLGVFKLKDNLWWYVAVRDGQAILPEGDVVGDYATILEVRRRHEAYGDWNVHDGTIDDLLPILELVSKSSAVSRVKSVEPPPIWKGLLPVAFASSVVLVGALIYVNHQHQVHKAAREAFVAVIKAREQMVSPLVKTPPPNEWLAACMLVLEPQKLAENGWLADKVSCTGKIVVIHWLRIGNATVLSRPQGDLSSDGNMVLQQKAMEGLPPGDNTMVNYIKADEEIFALLQPIDVQANIGKATRFSTDAFFTQDVQFTLPISPLNINFDQVTGLRITSLEWTTNGWVIGGEIYGQ